MGLTQDVANFVSKTRYRDIPTEVVCLARGFILDGLGVALAVFCKRMFVKSGAGRR